ncbi:MAG: hypothetical protein H7210_12525, partial [Pyrinomonadaceae bacterium]|nr:hypothetical protein [Phycisphaerales bacterium]
MRHTGTIERGACLGGRERGFALAELLAVLIMLIAIGAVIGAFMPDARRRSQMSGSLTNLQRLGAAAADYGMENADSVFSFTWRASAMGQRCDNGDDTYTFPPASTDLQAAANQAICILRRQGRRDIQQITGWIPHIQYNHLALADYLGEQLPSRLFVSPGDRFRLEWQDALTRNPANPRQGFFDLTCRPFGNSNNESRWPYSSSYEMPPAFFSPDAAMNGVQTIGQGPDSHRTYTIGSQSMPLGRRILSEIRHPSQKAMMFETN